LGAARGRTFTTTVGRNRVTAVTQPAANGSPAATKTYAYDANGNMAEVVDLNGNVKCAVYDLTRNLETGRVEGLASGSTCPTNIATYVPTAGTVQRKILTQYHPTWHLPIKRAEPLRITTWVYNGDGGVYCAPTTAKVGTNPIGVLCSMTIQPTTDATGGAGFSATATGTARTWSYTYNNFGQVLTAVGPSRSGYTDTTTYTYYTCTTGGKCGQIDTVQNQVGHVTTYNTYNGNGQPLTLTDPNPLCQCSCRL
jgi:YD repeat-containing protein